MECKCELITQSKVIKFSISADSDMQVYLRHSFNRFWNTLNYKKYWINQFYSSHREKKGNLNCTKKLVKFFQEHKILTGREEKGWSLNRECSVIWFFSDNLTLILPYFILYQFNDGFVVIRTRFNRNLVF